MPPTALIFPHYNSLWLFKSQTHAINIAIIPKTNHITGLFDEQDIKKALQEFQATKAEGKPEC